MEKILQELGIFEPGQVGKNNSYIVDLESDAAWGKIYSILETNNDVEQLEDNTLLTVHNASLLYIYKDKYQLNLKADFDNEIYSLICSNLNMEGKLYYGN